MVPLITLLGIRLLIFMFFYVKVVKLIGLGCIQLRDVSIRPYLCGGKESHFIRLGLKGSECNRVSSKLDCYGWFYLCKHW